jgi:hypothetical protein
MKTSAKAPQYPSSKASGEYIADLLTRPAVVPAFLQFGLVFD